MTNTKLNNSPNVILSNQASAAVSAAATSVAPRQRPRGSANQKAAGPVQLPLPNPSPSQPKTGKPREEGCHGGLLYEVLGP